MKNNYFTNIHSKFLIKIFLINVFFCRDILVKKLSRNWLSHRWTHYHHSRVQQQQWKIPIPKVWIIVYKILHFFLSSSLCSNSHLIPIKFSIFLEFSVRIMHISSIGDLGYELHIENKECVSVYKKLLEIGSKYGLKNAGFRAYNSLNCEKGIYNFHWTFF